MSEAGPSSRRRSWLNILINFVASVAILGGSAAGVWWIYQTEPEAQQINAKRKSAALVETITVERGTYAPKLVVLGTVQPAQDIVLSPRIRGEVQRLSSSFVPGGMIRAGEMLLEIDPADFENAVSIRKSELEQVEADWKIEEGRQKLAKQELELLGDSIGEVNRALVLREPQSASIKSQLAAAKAAVERAELDLNRTQLLAPFDAQILRRSVNVGSQVQPGDDLGQLIGIDEYWVMAAVPVRNLRWVQFPDESQDGDLQGGSIVTLHDPDAWGPSVTRQGRVVRMIGALDQQTRLARVLVAVKDPLGLRSDVPPLILDTLIEVQIAGREIDDVIRLGRDYVHDRNTVWVMKDNQLEIRTADIVFQDPQYAYIRNGLEAGEEVVTTTLATVANGVQLRKLETPVQPGSDASPSSPEVEYETPTQGVDLELGSAQPVLDESAPAKIMTDTGSDSAVDASSGSQVAPAAEASE